MEATKEYKFLIFSDIHLHIFKAFNSDTRWNTRLTYSLDCLELMFAAADKYNIKTILFPGDLFDLAKFLPTEVVNRVTKKFKELFEKYPEIEFISISGNHDQATQNLRGKPAHTSQEFLSVVFDRFHLIDNDTIMVGEYKIVGMPYYEYPEDFNKELRYVNSNLDEKDKPCVLLMHQTPEECKDSGRMQVDVSSRDELFKPYQMVFNGHIHLNEEIQENFIDVGCPIQQERGERAYDCGFYLWDGTDRKGLEFKSLNEMYPVFIDIEEGEDLPPGAKDTDYITTIPKLIVSTGDEQDVERASKFQAHLPSVDLLDNYVQELPDEVLEKHKVPDRDRLKKVGISFLKD